MLTDSYKSSEVGVNLTKRHSQRLRTMDRHDGFLRGVLGSKAPDGWASRGRIRRVSVACGLWSTCGFRPWGARPDRASVGWQGLGGWVASHMTMRVVWDDEIDG